MDYCFELRMPKSYILSFETYMDNRFPDLFLKSDSSWNVGCELPEFYGYYGQNCDSRLYQTVVKYLYGPTLTVLQEFCETYRATIDVLVHYMTSAAETVIEWYKINEWQTICQAAYCG